MNAAKQLNFCNAFIGLIGLLASAISFASECDISLSKSGNFLAGTVYKTTVDLPIVSADLAWQGAESHIAKDGWNIQQADRAAGVILAQNAKATRPTPLSVTIERNNNGSKLSIAYTMPPGTASPDQAIRTAFCNLAAAAAAGVNSADVASTPNLPAAAQKRVALGLSTTVPAPTQSPPATN